MAIGCSEPAPSPTASPADAASPVPDDAACPAPAFRPGSSSACIEGAYARCPDGSRPRESGWGCEAIVPAKACEGATRDALGSESCVPVGECDAPFPPATATLFVDPSGPVDAARFRTLAAAIAAAPAGAVVAVEAGAYPESLVVTKDVTILGRCAAKVSLVGGGTRVRGIRVEGARVTVRGVTVVKQFIGVSVGPGGALTLEDSVLDDNDTAGILLSEPGARVEASRVVVRGTRPGTNGDRGAGINVQAGSVAVLRDSAFVANHGQNIRISSGSDVTVDRVVSRDGRPSPAFDFGRGLSVQDGAKARVSRSAFLDDYEVALLAGDAATLDLVDVVVGRTQLASSGSFGRALNAFGGAKVHGEGLHVHDNHDASIMAAERGTSVTLSRSTVVDTAFDAEGYVGRGVVAQEGASVELTDSVVVGSREVAVAVFGPSRMTLRRSFVSRTAPNAGDFFGHGVLATMGGVVDVDESEIADSARIGIAIGDGAGRIFRSRVRGNEVGLHAEDGTTVRETSDAEAPIGAREVLVSPDTAFVANGTRLGGGTLPLPEPSRLGGR